SGPGGPDERDQATILMAEVRQEVGTLEIHARGAPRIEVRVDGEPLGEVEDGGGTQARTDAGRHLVSAHAPDMRSEEERVYLDRGEHARVDLRLYVRLTGGGSVFEEPWFWAVLTSVLVSGAAALAIGLGYYYSQDTLVHDPVYGNTMTLLRW